MKNLRLLSLTILSCFFCAGISSAQSIIVVLKMYAGRENPSFTITDSGQIAQIESLYANNGGSSAGTPQNTEPYNGIELSSSGVNMPSLLNVQNGYLQQLNSSNNSVSSTVIDSSKQLENYLFTLAENYYSVISYTEANILEALRDGVFNNQQSEPPVNTPPN